MGHRVLRETDWGEIGFGQLSQELVEEMTPPLERFFMSKTKAHLAEQALERRILLFPVHDPRMCSPIHSCWHGITSEMRSCLRSKVSPGP